MIVFLIAAGSYAVVYGIFAYIYCNFGGNKF